MRTLALVAATVLLAVHPAAAENPYSCSAGTIAKLKINPPKTTMRFTGTFTQPGGFDPVANGLTLDLWAEPETNPGNLFYTATLPGSGFTTLPNGQLRYVDAAGTQGGITLVKIRTIKTGDKRITVKRKSTTPITTPPGGVFRVLLTSGTGCVRHCGTSCPLINGKLKCKKSTDTTLCGLRSGCELLNSSGGHCMLPYPSTWFERDDATTPTGKRLDYQLLAMPANMSGVHIENTKYNAQLDGFSPGTMMMANFPQGVDAAASNLNTWQNYLPSLNPATSPTILLDYDTGELIEHFAEVDVSIAPSLVPVAPPTQVLIVRPGRRLKNGGHYIVALRNLIKVGGGPIAAEPAFQALRDGTPSGSHLVEPRRAAFEDLFTRLGAAGVARNNLILAWDFHTASDFAIQNWLVQMRNDTFEALGVNAPPFAVTLVEDNPLLPTLPDSRVCRRVRGTYQVPLYTTFDGTGSILNVNPVTNLPEQNGVTNAPFTAFIPCSLVNPTPSSGRPIFYGHGLLGSGFGEVTSGHLRQLADDYGYVVAATDWQGMSNPDLPTVFAFIADLSEFRKLSERLHQGILNQLVLGHLLGAADGLSTDPAFIYGGVPVIDPSEVFYYGNSQGGIFGGTVMALSQETTRGVLGVPAANFSTLLQRSIDFDPYFALLRDAYPNDLDRAVTYPLLQQLWDKAEPNGWYHHTVSNPLTNTPAHKVLIHMATSDEEVSNVATEIMVRSMGIPQVSPVVTSYYNIPEMAAPFDGSAMVESDGNYGPIPIGNVPPPDYNAHGAMRALPEIQSQIDQFLRTGGNIQNFCTGPCNPN